MFFFSNQKFVYSEKMLYLCSRKEGKGGGKGYGLWVIGRSRGKLQFRGLSLDIEKDKWKSLFF